MARFRIAVIIVLLGAALVPPALATAATTGTDAQALAAVPATAGRSSDTSSPADTPSVDVTDDAGDLALSQRVARRLQNADGMEDVTVSVSAGVARLDGQVLKVEDRVLAAQIAAQQPGIASVDNRVELSTRLSDRFDVAIRQVIDKLVRLLAALPLLAVAIVIVLLAWALGRALARKGRLTRWSSTNPYLDSLVRRLVQWVVLLSGVLIALDLLGATALVGAVLGSAGVVGLVLGFAFKDIAENYVAGVLLSLRRPFAPGDHLRVEGFEGKVAALTSRTTVLVTLDGNHLSLPNAVVFKSVVLNFTRNPKRRFDFLVPIDPGESIAAAQQLAMERIRGIDGVLADPGPSWQVKGYEGPGINLQVFGWIDQRHSDLGKTRSAAIRQVTAAFGEAGIEGPRSVQFLRRLPEAAATPPAAVASASATAATTDTSVNRDIDEQLAGEQRALSGDNLI